VAVTAVQLAAAAIGALPAALLIDGRPGVPGLVPSAATAGLAVGGTLLPFTLFAWAQARVSPEIAGAFLNLEPLVGVVLGAVAFGDPVGVAQIAGGLAILGGIALNATALTPRRDRTPMPASRRRRRPRFGAGPRPAAPATRHAAQTRRPPRGATVRDRPPVHTRD
jgi:threonine/homoserine efflux transporter RhtA